ncbi:MAG: NAD-dependent succinate-semialdehyde dehydrogenase [Halieaceae bacterium]|nr:NAD-dependent succinate-semialdehyde dehydrogenase [Halieaceae bacterium]
MSLFERLQQAGNFKLHIGGEWRDSSDGAALAVFDPATEQSVAEIPSASVEDARLAVDAAADAFTDFAAMSPVSRAEILRSAYELMTGKADELAGLIVLEMGKAYAEARAEVVYAAEFFRWYAGEATRNIGYLNTAPAGDKRILAIHQPIGVSLLVTPWNFPAAMATRKIAPAIAAGCSMVLKPASDTPLTALAVAKILEKAGLPPGVLNVLPSRRSGEVVNAMLSDQRVRNLSFTGSTEVGQLLLEQCSRRVVRASMELGGNAPLVVFEDADLDEAVAGCMIAKMRNGGQSCIGANRLIVHEAIATEFSGKLCDAMSEVKMGPGMEAGVTLGPLINEQAVRDMVRMTEECIDAGASLELGGSAPESAGYYFAPTLITAVAPDNPILSREIFGPIAPVVTFESEEEAIRLANNSELGLAAYVFTGDFARGLRISEAIEAGMVGINRGLISDPAAPFGGVKESGLGREGSHEGLHEFLETKYISADW